MIEKVGGQQAGSSREKNSLLIPLVARLHFPVIVHTDRESLELANFHTTGGYLT